MRLTQLNGRVPRELVRDCAKYKVLHSRRHACIHDTWTLAFPQALCINAQRVALNGCEHTRVGCMGRCFDMPRTLLSGSAIRLVCGACERWSEEGEQSPAR
eukprot:5379896-Amphidinium_carterae.1